MSTLTRIGVMLGILSMAAAASAQPPAQGRNYNPATETTLTGTVDGVVNVAASGGQGGGLHLTLTTASGPIEVHVGPVWYVKSKNVSFAAGDSVSVIGSKITIEGQTVLIARQITKGDQVLTLRNANGIPLWSGRGRGRGR